MATVESLQAKLKEAVKQYEGKLAALSALNSALQKECDQLRDELDEALQPKTEAELDALELKEEFARRLGEQQRTIDILKDTNQKLQAKVRDAAADSSAAEASLTALQDKLSKQQQEATQLTAKVIELEKGSRRLNHRVKELENERDKYANKVQLLEIQLTEAQQTAAAAEQSAAARIHILQQEHAEALAAAQQELESVRGELQEQLKAVQQSAAAGSEQVAAAAAEREAMLCCALAEAQAAVQSCQDQQAQLQERHQAAAQRLREQVRQLESEKQELLSDAGGAHTSLMRQIQSLAAQLSAAQAGNAEQEQLLLSRLRAAEHAAGQAAAAEQDAAGKAAAADAATAAAREAATAAVQESVSLRSRLESVQRHSRALEAERNAAQDRLAAAHAREQQLQQELQQQQRQLQEQLHEAQNFQLMTREKESLQQELIRVKEQQQQAEQAAVEQAAAAVSQLQDEMQRLNHLQSSRNSNAGKRQQQQQGVKAIDPHDSSLNGLLQQLGSLNRPTDEDQGSSPVARLGSSQQSSQQQLLQVRSGSGSSGVLTLSPALADIPEVQQLHRLMQQQQQELAAAVEERDAAAEQLYQAMRQADAAAAAVQEAEKLRQQHRELENKLEVALEIIGERSLQIEELEADILDMRTIFHAQLEEAMAQVQAAANGISVGSGPSHNHVH